METAKITEGYYTAAPNTCPHCGLAMKTAYARALSAPCASRLRSVLKTISLPIGITSGLVLVTFPVSIPILTMMALRISGN